MQAMTIRRLRYIRLTEMVRVQYNAYVTTERKMLALRSCKEDKEGMPKKRSCFEDDN